MIGRVFNLARMLRNERVRPDLIRQLQEQAFLKLFRHVYENVPFYRDLYRDHGISRADVCRLEDISKLPIVDKNQLRRAAAANQLWANSERHISIRTSGSSGEPFRFYVDCKGNDWRKAQYLLPYVSSGRKPWERVLRLTASDRPRSVGIRRFLSFREVAVRADRPPERHYEILSALNPTILQGYPSALASLAWYIREHSLPVPKIRSIFTDSEILLPEVREELQSVFDANVVDVFGTYETDNIAYECSERTGHHVAEDSVIIETLDDSGVETQSSSGELICTVLHNSTTPFLRYDTGDKVEVDSGSCACGRTSRRLVAIRGRSNDAIAFPDGTRRDALALIRVLGKEFLGRVREFQIRQKGQRQFVLLLVQERKLTTEEVGRFHDVFMRELPFAETDVRIVERIDRTDAGKRKVFVGIDSFAECAC